jgi:maltooligosyltrehalose synthase
VFALAAETGWPEERILHMPLARLAQYQHCLLRRHGVRTSWSNGDLQRESLQEAFAAIRICWERSNGSFPP